MKKIVILTPTENINIEKILNLLDKKVKIDICAYDEIFLSNINPEDVDLIIMAGKEQKLPENFFEKPNNVINIHPSLLPAFKTQEAIKESFFAGVKVSGTTIHWVEKENFYGKIITQFPVFITNEMSYPEYIDEIIKIQDKLYPTVIEKLLEDKIFDFQDLMKSNCQKGDDGCSSGCGGCKN